MRSFSLRDAQLVVAREYGFENWTALKRHVEEASRAVDAGVVEGQVGGVRQLVPFFAVSDMASSLALFVDRLGFDMRTRWDQDGRLVWCRLDLGTAGLMLQQFRTAGRNARVYEGRRGGGTTFAYVPGRSADLPRGDWPFGEGFERVEQEDGYTVMGLGDVFGTGAGKGIAESVVAVLEVVNVEQSLAFYVDGIGFEVTDRWESDGAQRGARLQYGEATVVLQAVTRPQQDARAERDKHGQGVSIFMMCDDALAIYAAARARGVAAQEPFVGNGMWVVRVTDPDGTRLSFESQTDAPEESTLSEVLPAGGEER